MKVAGALGRLLAVVGIATAAACSGGAPTPAAPPAATPTLETPSGTAIVARVPLGGAFSWSPDGRYLLIGNQNGSSVYDRHGKLVSQFPGQVGWLDETHILGIDGKPRTVTESQGPGYFPNQWVVANGRGTAYVVVAVPGCTGDPIVDRYRNGKYERTQEKLTPFGFSPDGALALEGHLDCSSEDAELHGWKGDVAIVNAESGQTTSTLHGVRGPMSFDLYGKSFAAQSDGDLIVATGGESHVSTLQDTRLLAWLDEETLVMWGSPATRVTMDEPTELKPMLGPNDFPIVSPIAAMDRDGAPALQVTFQGRILGVQASAYVFPNGRLIDLSGENLAIATNRTPAATDYVATSLLPRYWSPDGRMLALPAADGSKLDLVSVDPSTPGESDASPAPSPTDTPFVPEVSPSTTAASPAATGKLPALPTLATAIPSATRIDYQVSVAPVATPLTKETATARAKQIGALVGLSDPWTVYETAIANGDTGWRANYVQQWDGIPVEPYSVALIMRGDGTVQEFWRETGPRAPKPARTITQAEAERVLTADVTVTDAQLVWFRRSLDRYYLVWALQLEKSGTKTGAVWVDAGTGEVLDAAALSG